MAVLTEKARFFLFPNSVWEHTCFEKLCFDNLSWDSNEKSI